jgi:hypothetical protein
MNEALLMKWVWRLDKDKEGDAVCEILKAKYLQRKNFVQHSGNSGSQFWRGVNKIKNLFSLVATFEVHNAEKTRFWEDV